MTAYRTAGNAKMTFACLAYCTTCDKETKWRLEWTHTGNYPIAYTLDNWVCNECAATVPYTAFYPDTPDITITGIPPGRHTIHDGAPAGKALDFELAADEWSLLPVYDENQEIDHYNIYFSPFVINHLEAAQGYKIRVYYVGGSVNGEEFVLPDHFPDFEIDDAFANAIEGANTYVKLYDSAGELVTPTKPMMQICETGGTMAATSVISGIITQRAESIISDFTLILAQRLASIIIKTSLTAE